MANHDLTYADRRQFLSQVLRGGLAAAVHGTAFRAFAQDPEPTKPTRLPTKLPDGTTVYRVLSSMDERGNVFVSAPWEAEPWRWVGVLADASGSHRGTGAFVGRRLVLTAAHVAVGGGTWGEPRAFWEPRDWTFAPAAQGHDARLGKFKVLRWWAEPRYYETRCAPDDWAVVEVEGSPHPHDFFEVWDGARAGLMVTSAGYPGEKDPVIRAKIGLTMWMRSYPIKRVEDAGEFLLDQEVIHGCSGAPAWAYWKGRGRWVVGVLARGIPTDVRTRLGPSIFAPLTRERVELIKKWREHGLPDPK